MVQSFGRLFVLPTSYWLIYLVVYLGTGFFMNQVGIWSNIARFNRWWQVFTCYGLYMIPISVLLRGRPFHEQYLWGLFAMCILEFLGYALGTSQVLGVEEDGHSIHVRNNILAKIVNIKNFSLAMAIFFGLYIPAGNWLVEQLVEKTRGLFS